LTAIAPRPYVKHISFEQNSVILQNVPTMSTIDINDLEVFGATLADWCGVSPKRIDQLLAEGVVHREAKGRFRLKANVTAVFRWLRSDQRRCARTEADAQLRRERAREIRLRIAERERQLVPIDLAFQVQEEILGLVRTEIGGASARITRDLALRRQIDEALNEVLARVVSKLHKEIELIKGAMNGSA
jgi:hypothetical protein